MKLFASIVLSITFACALAITKEELQTRAVQLLNKIEDSVRTLIIDPNSNEEDIESLRFQEDAIRSVLRELERTGLSNRILNLLVTKIDDIESETEVLLKTILGTTTPVPPTVRTVPPPPPTTRAPPPPTTRAPPPPTTRPAPPTTKPPPPPTARPTTASPKPTTVRATTHKL